MKTHLIFSEGDKPVQMGPDHKIDGAVDSNEMVQFLKDRSEILVEATISKDKKTLSFVKAVDEKGNKIIGTASLEEHGDDFTNIK
jgi:hypothetical protein